MAKNNDTNFFWQSKYTAGRDGKLESESFVDGSDALANGGKMVLSFLHVASEQSVFFKAFITKYDESWKAEWKGNPAFGRTDPIYTYSNTVRHISLAFSVPASSESEAFENMGRIGKLSQMMYPTYSDSDGQKLLAQAPLMRIKALNLIQDVSKLLSSEEVPQAPVSKGRKKAARKKNDVEKRNELYNQYLSSPDPEKGLLCAVNNISISTEMTKEGVLEKGPNTVMPVNYNVTVDFAVIHEKTLGWDTQGDALAPNYPYGNRILEASDALAVDADQTWKQRLDKERGMQAAIDSTKARYAGLFGNMRARQDRNRADGHTYINLGVVGVPAPLDWGHDLHGNDPMRVGRGQAAERYLEENDVWDGSAEDHYARYVSSFDED